MNVTTRISLTALILAALTAGGWAQTQTASNAAPPTPSVESGAAAPSPEQQLRSELEQLKQIYAVARPDAGAQMRWPGLTWFRVRPKWAPGSHRVTDQTPEDLT